MGKCILICAGDFTLMPVTIEEDDLVIAVDAGLGYCRLLDIKPHVVLGDFDSTSNEDLELIEEIRKANPQSVVTLPKIKDDTDTLAAIKYGLERGYREFRIYGAMGGRMDHYMANIQCLLYLKRHDATGFLVDGAGMVLLAVNEEVSFKEGLSGVISVFSMGNEARGVTIKGLKYEIQNAVITNDFPIGVSNEFVGTASSIEVKDGALAIIISWEV